MDDLLKGVIGLSVLVVLAGIISAALSGSDRAFDLKPIVKLWQSRAQQTAQGEAQLAVTPPPPPPKLATTAELMAECPAHSVNPQIVDVPFVIAEAIHQKVKAGHQFQDLIEVQEVLGTPKCHFMRAQAHHYRYLVVTNKAIDATQVGDQQVVMMTFVQF